MEVGYFSFGSSVSDYAVSKTIFEIKATEEKNNISTPIMSVSGKAVLSFGSLAASASPKISGGGFAAYSSTSRPGGFRFGLSTGVSGFFFYTFPKIKKYCVSGAAPGNITLSSKARRL